MVLWIVNSLLGFPKIGLESISSFLSFALTRHCILLMH